MIWEPVSNRTGKENVTEGKRGSKSIHSSKNISYKKQNGRLSIEGLLLRGKTPICVSKGSICGDQQLRGIQI